MGMQHSISIRATRHALVLAILLPAIAAAQRPVSIAPNAPEDRGPSVTQCQWDSVVKAMEPLVQQARTTYPSAKVRFLRGLPANRLATVLWWHYNPAAARRDILVGTAVILGGANGHGHDTRVPDDVVDVYNLISPL